MMMHLLMASLTSGDGEGGLEDEDLSIDERTKTSREVAN